MVEALLAAHIADRGLGHDHAFQAAGDVGAGLTGRPDLGHGQQVAQGDHADQVPVVDHRKVAVVVVGEARPGRIHFVVDADHVGVGRHPPADRLGVGIGLRGGGPE